MQQRLDLVFFGRMERGAHLVDILVPASDIGITEEHENADGYEYTCQ